MKRFEHWRQLLATAAVIAIAVLGAAPPALAVRLNEPIVPLPATLNVNPARAEIGRQMFHDVRLSANSRVSCASCHNISTGGADSRPHSVGFGGQQTGVNAPTVFNAALNFVQFWNGRAATLEDQIDGVVQNPVEMGSKWNDVVAMVNRDKLYRPAFAAAYPDEIGRASCRERVCYAV